MMTVLPDQPRNAYVGAPTSSKVTAGVTKTVDNEMTENSARWINQDFPSKEPSRKHVSEGLCAGSLGGAYVVDSGRATLDLGQPSMAHPACGFPGWQMKWAPVVLLTNSNELWLHLSPGGSSECCGKFAPNLSGRGRP